MLAFARVINLKFGCGRSFLYLLKIVEAGLLWHLSGQRVFLLLMVQRIAL
jgi:hypothetical protein